MLKVNYWMFWWCGSISFVCVVFLAGGIATPLQEIQHIQTICILTLPLPAI